MKRSNVLLYLCFLISVMIITQTCKKTLTEEERLTQKEEKIIDKLNDFMPDEVVATYESSFNSQRSEIDYTLYLDSLEIEVDDLKNAIQLNFTLDDFKKALSTAYTELNNSRKGSGNNYLGLGYAKGVRVEPGVSGTIGALVVAGLQASGGGGIKIVYDFVNLERQIYFYSICSYGINIGVGIAAVMQANAGFSGVNEVITGIRYHGPTAVRNSFDGQSKGMGFSVSGEASAVGGISLSAGFGISKSAFADFNGIANGLPCPHNMVDIVNGTTSYSIKVTGSISVGAQADLMALFKANVIGTNSVGINSSYTKFSSDRSRAGIKMAKELLLPNPINGFYAFSSPLDLPAAAAAIVTSKKDFSKFPPEKPSIGTIGLTKITSADAEGGGIVKDDGGSIVTSRGVCWSTIQNPTISDSHTTDGLGEGNFTSKLSGLSPTTKYYVRAYATNAAGTTYGYQESFTTLSGSGTIPTNGLVAYYPFNGNANDESGNNNNGTVSGATLTSDRKGNANKAYLFDGTNDYIEINHSASLNFNQQITISFWAKLETDAPYYYPYHMIEKHNCWGMGQRENEMGSTIFTSTNQFHIWSKEEYGVSFQFNRFYHFVMTYDGTKLNFYADGVLKATTPANGLIAQNTNKVFIGRYNFSGDYFFDGILDDIRIYNRALTQQEITALYNE